MKKSNCFMQVLKMVMNIKPAFMSIIFVLNLLSSLVPFLNIYISAKLLDGMIDQRPQKELTALAIILVTANMIITLIRWSLDKWSILMRREIDDTVEKIIAEKTLTLDYQVIEKTETLDMITRAREGAQSRGGISNFCIVTGAMVGYFVTIIYAVSILTGLFISKSEGDPSGMIAFIDTSLAAVIVIFVILVVILLKYKMSLLNNKMQYMFFEKNVIYNRKFDFFGKFMINYEKGKDIRIYNMQKIILKLMNDTAVELEGNDEIRESQSILYDLIIWSFDIVLMFVSYAFVGMKAISGAISIGQLALYVGSLTNMIKAISQIFEYHSFLGISSRYLNNYVEFLKLKNEKYDGTLPIEKRQDNDYELEFKNVSFHYPNSEEEVLKNVTAKIHVGRKMAIVGKNGSGKSTFIKLLCRLYDPTEGQILLNGIDIKKYDYDEYRQIFGVVFQDFNLFSFSVAQNVAAGVEYDKEKVKKCLEEAGMWENVKKMKKGMDTIIYKQEDEGVEISGGEAQKIAIARALYKEAPVVILDEPTAALDPVSELEIYERFDEMIGEKTAIYISHRMSSCRFCENILVFDKGNIIQMGGHNRLVAEDGLYRELWEAQAQYYR